MSKKVVKVDSQTYDLAHELARVMSFNEQQDVTLMEIFRRSVISYSVAKLRSTQSTRSTELLVTESTESTELLGNARTPDKLAVKKVVPSNVLSGLSLNSPESQDSPVKENPLKGVKEKNPSRPARKAVAPAWESPDWWKPIETLDGYKPSNYEKQASQIAQACANEGIGLSEAVRVFSDYYRAQKARNGWKTPVRPFQSTLHITIRDILRMKGGTNGKFTGNHSAEPQESTVADNWARAASGGRAIANQRDV